MSALRSADGARTATAGQTAHSGGARSEPAAPVQVTTGLVIAGA